MEYTYGIAQQKAEVLVFTITTPPPFINVAGIEQDICQHDSAQNCIGRESATLSPVSDKVYQLFFYYDHDNCRSICVFSNRWQQRPFSSDCTMNLFTDYLLVYLVYSEVLLPCVFFHHTSHANADILGIQFIKKTYTKCALMTVVRSFNAFFFFFFFFLSFLGYILWFRRTNFSNKTPFPFFRKSQCKI